MDLASIRNAIDTDSYKFSHAPQYPKDIIGLTAYGEARKQLALPANLNIKKGVVFFGMQDLLVSVLSQGMTKDVVDFVERVVTAHGEPFDRAGFDIILNEYEGKWPVEIKAVPEGTLVPIGVPLYTVSATDQRLVWAGQWLETQLLRAAWYGTTVCTISFYAKQIIKSYMEETCDDLSGLLFALHDFGSRGVSSFESAGIGGAAHLVNFSGSDTLAALITLYNSYDADITNAATMPAYSIPAAEHSTITIWGRQGESAAYKNMIKQFASKYKVFAVVSDSYDIFNAVEKIWGEELKQDVIDSGALLVIRPDSGVPADVVAHCLKLLDEKFGSTLNSKGYKVLNHVRIMQGDGINLNTINEILFRMRSLGFAANNVAFGMGGALLQKVDRDTFGFAQKASAKLMETGEWIGFSKDPITDQGKRSKEGVPVAAKDKDGNIVCVQEHQVDEVEFFTLMQTVYFNGNLFNLQSLADIRKVVDSYL